MGHSISRGRQLSSSDDQLLHFEDFEADQSYDLGTHKMTSEEILDFARRFDPQPFHVDEERAKGSVFGGLVASGWHTASVFMRLYVGSLLARSAAMGSPGVEELRWLKPVRPGDVLSASLRVLRTEPSSCRSDRGTVFVLAEVVNQKGETVMTMKARGYFRRRRQAG